ncbi:MAG TPA: bifunctional precorrin-2 dehydrogenase/sirohydrochlorin ferrochelatase [Candidatus Obscuribacterales bacterium]
MTSYSAPAADIAFMPLNLRVMGRLVLVVGAGRATLPEINRLIEFGASVDVIAPHVMTEIEELALAYSNRLTVKRRKFQEEDRAKILSRHYCLVFSFSGDEEENATVFNAAQEAGIPAASSEPAITADFMIPTMVKRGHLKIAVSTDGISPAVEKALLHRIEGSLVSEIDNYVLFLSSMRETLTWLFNDSRLSKSVVKDLQRQFADSEEIYRAVSRNNFEEARKLVERIIEGNTNEANETTTV